MSAEAEATAVRLPVVSPASTATAGLPGAATRVLLQVASTLRSAARSAGSTVSLQRAFTPIHAFT
jgi:hypothetical protein